MIGADIVKKWLNVYKQFYNKINFSEIKNYINKDFKNEFHKLIKKVTNLTETNYDLGIYHFNHNMISDAILRFKMTKFFDPSFAKADYYLGRCYYEKHNYSKSKLFIDRYLNTQDQTYIKEAEFTLNTINRSHEIIEIPISIIRTFFDKIAFKYDEIFINNQTTIPQHEMLIQLVNALNDTSQLFGNNILDLGCGTGVIGRYLRLQKIANMIIGVDISSNSLKIAEQLLVDEMKVYNRLEEMDVNKFLQKFDDQKSSKFNIIIASNYITYNCNLNDFFKQNFLISKESGLLCISFKCIERHEEQVNLRFEQFYYSTDYIIDIAKNYGWVVYSINDTVFTTQEKGKIIIFNKIKD